MHLKKLLAQSLFWRGLYFVSLLLVNVFLSRYLQAGWIGWLYYTCNIFSLFVIILSLNLDAGITYFASGKKINSNRLMWLSLVWSIIVALTIWGGLKLFPQLITIHTGLHQSSVLFFALCYICGTIIINIITGLFYAKGNFRLPNLIMILFNTVLIFFILRHTNANSPEALENILNIYFLFFLLEGFFLLFIFMLKNKSWSEFHLPSLVENKKIYTYSLVALLANIVFFLVYRIDYWFVEYYCSNKQLGNYVQVNKLGQMLLIIPQIIASAVFPKTASGNDQPATREIVMIISRVLTACYVLLIIISFAFGYWLFPFIFGVTFNEMYFPFLILLPGIWCLSILALLAAYFAGKGNVKINVTGGLFSVVLMIIGNFIFLPRGGGIIAAAAISSAAYFFYMLYLMQRFKKDYNIELKDFLFARKEDFLWIAGLLKVNSVNV